ncbi:MAG: hypothetical protein Q8N87_01170 [bacterium]|nr:hypothetical protein [bacterium]
MFKIEKKNIFLLILIIIVLIGIIFLLVFYFSRQQKPPSPEPLSEDFVKNMPRPERTIKGKVQGIDYEVVRESRINHPFAQIKTYDVIVPIIDRSRVEVVTERIIEEITADDPEVDKISLVFFSDKSMISTSPFDIAYAVWGSAKEMTREIADNNLRDNYKIDILMKNEMREGE